MEWALNTPAMKTFKTRATESGSEVDAPANLVRISAILNDTKACLFHIRLIYGRPAANGGFEPSIRDDGIVIGGPNYADLDTNQDGLISEDELLSMSATILGWDGELKRGLPAEGLA